MENRIFEDHSAFNKFMIMEGLNQTEATNQLSEYITCVKLKKLFAKFSRTEIENLFNKEMSDIAVKRHREKLEEKLYRLQRWQLFRAFKICEDYIYEAAAYVIKCKRTDKDEATSNTPNL